MELEERRAPPSDPLQKELYFLIAKFLEGGPCQRASRALIEEIEENEIIPKSVNWLGDAVSQDFNTFSSKFNHISPDHLPKLVDQLVKLLDAKESTPNSAAGRSLLSHSTCSIVTKTLTEKTGLSWSKRIGQNVIIRNLLRNERKSRIHPVHAIADRALTGGIGIGHSFIQPDFYKRIGLSRVTLGHLSAVYCVLFDISGKYIFTGADDRLIKIWSAIDGRLIMTLRGTSAEIVDLAINQENTMLAVASCERTIRVWCLKTGAPIATLHGQGGNTTSIFFCPMPRSRSQIRYLASTSTDGSCAFWAYSEESGGQVVFQAKPTLYLERMRPGSAKMICSSFSCGGLFMASGSADNHVRVYHMLGSDGPERILEVEHHSDRVDSITWAHEGLRFVSGSKDGTALIWRFENACWRYIRLSCSKNQGEGNVVYEDRKQRSKVTMVGWNTDDTLVLTAVSDFMVRVWNSTTGELVRVLKGHTAEAYVIEPHPFNPRIVCTAGHDGNIIIWDVGSTNMSVPYLKIFQYYNQLGEGQGHGAVFDCKWAPDGLSLAATDSHGHLLLFTIEGKNSARYKKLPEEIFFHTDYRPLSRDAITNEIVDEQTQVPPHLMPPPFLVDVDGNPYPPALQRFVPGRENMNDEYLTPHVAVSERGYQEVIEGLPSAALQPVNPIPPPAQPLPPVPAELPANPRSNIDEMIQQLAIEQGLQRNRENRPPPNNGEERRGIGHRRSGEVEGVRQSRGNWETVSDETKVPTKKQIIPPLAKGTLKTCENKKTGILEAEESWYQEHLTKYSPVNVSSGSGIPAAMGSPVETSEGRSRRIRRLAAQAAERRQLDNEEHENFSQLEGVARPNPRPQMEISVSQDSPRRRQRARGAQRRAVIATINNTPNRATPRSRPRPVRFDVGRIMDMNGSDVENLDFEDSSSEAHVNSSSDSSSSDSDSDWGGNLGASARRRNQQQQSRRTDAEGRTRAARTNSHSSESENNRRGEESEEEEEEEEEERPVRIKKEPVAGPSSEITGSSSPTTITIKSEQTKQSRPRKARVAVDYSGGLEDIPEQFRPCDWFSDQVPKRSPYFPQLGDDLIYYRQGHEVYIKYVEDNKLFNITKKMKKSLPYVLKPELEPEVSVRVAGIKFELEPPRVVVLKLARIDPETGEIPHPQHRNEHLYVKYHDVENVVDFLILKQMYDKSIRRRWNEGDRFRCLIQKDWWLGTVLSHEAKDQRFPNSNYLCYKVKWDNGDPDEMSPWDLDTVPDDFICPEEGVDGIPASEEDLRVGLYEPTASDWPPHGHQDAQCEKLSNLLQQVMELGIAELFSAPVDLNLYPEYAHIIEYPIDLSTMKARLDNRFYRRIKAFKFDAEYLVLNAEKFNEKNSDIVRNARVITEVCLQLFANPDITSVNPIYHKIMKQHEKNSSSPDSPTAKAGTSSKAGKSSSSKVTKSHHPSNSKMKLRKKHKQHYGGEDDDEDEEEEDERDWAERCLDLLNEIYHKKDAVPFREPVDIIEYPDYYQAIDTPMDLGSVREDLLGGNYNSPQHFHKDMMLIFSNSKQYNMERSPIYAMTCRLQALYECQIKPILSKNSRKKQRKKPTRSQQQMSPLKRSLRGASSITSTPRKNPKRSAAGKNRFVYHSDEETSEGDHGAANNSPNSPTRGLRSRQSSKRRNSAVSLHNGTSPRNGHSSRNGGNVSASPRHSTESSAAGSSITQPRRVKKLRLSPGESPPRSRTSRGNGISRNGGSSSSHQQSSPTHREGLRRHRVTIKDEPGSEEFEDSDEDVNMPVLNKVNDKDYNMTDNDSDDDGEYNSIRRSTRKSGKRRFEDDHYYETRNRGRPTRSYAENPEASEDDVEGRFGKRRRVITSSSPTRNTRSHSHSEPPVLRRKAQISSEEEEDDSDEDPNRPGPSSKLMRANSKQQQAGPSRTSNSPNKTQQRIIRNALDDEEEEEDEDEEEASDDESEDNSDESDHEVGQTRRTSARGAGAGSSRNSQPVRQRKPLRPKQNVSDDEDHENVRPRKSKASRSSRLPTRGSRPNYAEETDSEPTRPSVSSVSSRGRVRRKNSFLRD